MVYFYDDSLYRNNLLLGRFYNLDYAKIYSRSSLSTHHLRLIRWNPRGTTGSHVRLQRGLLAEVLLTNLALPRFLLGVDQSMAFKHLAMAKAQPAVLALIRAFRSVRIPEVDRQMALSFIALFALFAFERLHVCVRPSVNVKLRHRFKLLSTPQTAKPFHPFVNPRHVIPQHDLVLEPLPTLPALKRRVRRVARHVTLQSVRPHERLPAQVANEPPRPVLMALPVQRQRGREFVALAALLAGELFTVHVFQHVPPQRPSVVELAVANLAHFRLQPQMSAPVRVESLHTAELHRTSRAGNVATTFHLVHLNGDLLILIGRENRVGTTILEHNLCILFNLNQRRFLNRFRNFTFNRFLLFKQRLRSLDT